MEQQLWTLFNKMWWYLVAKKQFIVFPSSTMTWMMALDVFCLFWYYLGETDKKSSELSVQMLQEIAMAITRSGFFTIVLKLFHLSSQFTFQDIFFLWSSFSCKTLQLAWSHQSHALTIKLGKRTRFEHEHDSNYILYSMFQCGRQIGTEYKDVWLWDGAHLWHIRNISDISFVKYQKIISEFS